jgi:hypothetical protein
MPVVAVIMSYLMSAVFARTVGESVRNDTPKICTIVCARSELVGVDSRFSGVAGFNIFRLKGLVRMRTSGTWVTIRGELFSIRDGVGIEVELQFMPETSDSSKTRQNTLEIAKDKLD